MVTGKMQEKIHLIIDDLRNCFLSIRLFVQIRLFIYLIFVELVQDNVRL